MIDPIQSMSMSVKSVLETRPAPVQAEAAQTPPRAHDGFDAERFSQLMESAPVPRDRADVSLCPPSKTATGDCLGDRVLARISSMGEEFQKTWEEVADVVAGADNNLSMQDMLKAQLHLVRVATEYETIGKAIGKSTQNVDQMLRMQ